MAEEEPNFVDLACLIKINPESVLEKFGGQINASFFEAANIAGSMKQKGLVDFKSSYPGPNSVTVTDAGKAFLAEAESKSMEPIDVLDSELLKQLSGGKREPKELSTSLNIRPRDLALRLYKLNKNGLLVYDLKSGIVEVMLTEAGFLKVKNTPVQATAVAKPAAPAAPGADPNKPAEGAEGAVKPKMKLNKWIIAIVIVLILIVVGLYELGYI